MNLPREHIAAVPIYHSDKINKPLLQSDISDVGTPNLVSPLNGFTPQQIGIATTVITRL